MRTLLKAAGLLDLLFGLLLVRQYLMLREVEIALPLWSPLLPLTLLGAGIGLFWASFRPSISKPMMISLLLVAFLLPFLLVGGGVIADFAMKDQIEQSWE